MPPPNGKKIGEMSPEERIEYLKQNASAIKNLDDNQLKMAMEQMKNNKAMMKQMY